MTCGQVSEDELQAFVDGLLSSRRAAEIEGWLATRPEQRARIDGYMRDRRALRAALEHFAQAPIPSGLDIRRIARRPQGFLQRNGFQLAASLVLAFACGSGGWFLRELTEPPKAGIASLAREARENYAVYAPDRTRPVELGADARQTLISWGSERLARPVAIPDLSKAGFALLGGRLVATSHGPAILALYTGAGGSRLGIMVRDMEVDQNAPLAARSKDGLGVVTWALNGVGYGMVGRLGASSLQSVADVARRQIG